MRREYTLLLLLLLLTLSGCTTESAASAHKTAVEADTPCPAPSAMQAAFAQTAPGSRARALLAYCKVFRERGLELDSAMLAAFNMIEDCAATEDRSVSHRLYQACSDFIFSEQLRMLDQKEQRLLQEEALMEPPLRWQPPMQTPMEQPGIYRYNFGQYGSMTCIPVPGLSGVPTTNCYPNVVPQPRGR